MTSPTTTVTHTSAGSRIEFQVDQTFDDRKMRQYANGVTSVLHCHHYTGLFTQLAMDAEALEGVKHLTDASCEVFGKVLAGYYKTHGVEAVNDRLAIAEQYFGFSGLGEVRFEFGETEGRVTMPHAHVDEGWIKKWGERRAPVNHIGRGYIKAVWAAVFEKDPAACKVEETASIVCGAPVSEFTVNW